MGLIRYASEKNIEGSKKFTWTARTIAYSVLLFALLVIWGFLIGSRTNFDATILKQRGSTYQTLDDGMLSNIYEINLINKTKKDYTIELILEDVDGDIELAQSPLVLKAEEGKIERFVVKMNRKELTRGQRRFYITVLGNGKPILRKKTSFVGPLL
jgi:hypothetical protein